MDEIVNEPRMSGPQTIPVSEVPSIETVVGMAIGKLTAGRVARVEWGNYTAQARLIGTQWRGEIMIMVSRKVGT